MKILVYNYKPKQDLRRKNKFAVVTCLRHCVRLHITLFTFCQMTVGVGSPDTGTSNLSLFPATTTIVSGDWPRQSRWILGGSIVKVEKISFKCSLSNLNGKRKEYSCIKLKMKNYTAYFAIGNILTCI